LSVPDLESNISPETLDSSVGTWYLETTLWLLRELTVAGLARLGNKELLSCCFKRRKLFKLHFGMSSKSNSGL
jgi:hypothetical protein